MNNLTPKRRNDLLRLRDSIVQTLRLIEHELGISTTASYGNFHDDLNTLSKPAAGWIKEVNENVASGVMDYDDEDLPF